MPLPHHKGLGPGAQGLTAPEEMHHNPSLCFCVFCPEGDFEGAGMSLQVTRHPSLSVIVLSPLETTAGCLASLCLPWGPGLSSEPIPRKQESHLRSTLGCRTFWDVRVSSPHSYVSQCPCY